MAKKGLGKGLNSLFNEEDIEAIKDIFIGPVKDVIRIAKEKNEEVEEVEIIEESVEVLSEDEEVDE